jgi:hypothetical protein
MRGPSLAQQRPHRAFGLVCLVSMTSLLLCSTTSMSSAQRVPSFTRMTDIAGLDAEYSAPGVYGPGVAVMDIDGDGDLDLFVPNDRSGHKLYRNNGDGTFEDIAPQLGLDFVATLPAPEDVVNPLDNDPTTMMPCFIDTDNDGDLDLFITVWNGYSRYFENVEGQFVDRTHSSGLGIVGRSVTAAWGDFNRDGLLDVYVADWGGLDRLFRNEGNHRFTNDSERLGLYDRLVQPMPGWSAIWFDQDDDGWPDLYVGNDYGMANFLYMNKQTEFVDEARAHFPELLDPNRTILENNFSMGQAFGDFDRDGDYDLFVANVATNDLYERRGDMYYDLMEDRTQIGPDGPLAALRNLDIGWHCDWPDINHDGWVDLFLVNGYIRICPRDFPDCPGEGEQRQPNFLWLNRGDRSFADVTNEAGLADFAWGKAGAFADFDGDGDLDLFVTNSGSATAPSRHVFWRNDSVDLGNWLQIDLVGVRSNRDGYGTKLRVHVGEVMHMRDKWHSTGYLSQASPWVHFGLGDAQVIDLLEIRWPSGIVDRLENVNVNRRIRLVEGTTANGVSIPDAPRLGLRDRENGVELHWDVERESRFDRFLVMRTEEGRVAGNVAVLPSESGRPRYTWIDESVVDGATYRYSVIGERGDERIESITATITVRVAAARLALRPAVPNPFNPSTVLGYRVAAGATSVSLRIVDARGRSVTTFTPEAPGGWHDVVWDGTDDQGAPVASGGYRFVVEADGRRASTPLTLVR